MKSHLLSRRVHYWASGAVALPLVLIVGTGVLLQLKKQWAWVQPTERRGTGTEPSLSFGQILEACRSVPQAEIKGWPDVNRIDARPARGMLKVLARNGWEIQLDSRRGTVLQAAYRRSDVIEALHDGSWFHPAVKYGVFLPAGIALLLMWLTGLYLFLLPYWVKRKAAAAANGPPTA